MMRQATQLHEAGRLAEAETLYRQILSANPGHLDALHMLGVIAYQVGRNDAAVDLIGRVVARSPCDAEAQNNLAAALFELGRLEEAAAAARAAIALRPIYAEAWTNLGNALHALGQIEPAMAAYQQAVAHRPDFPQALNNLSGMLARQARTAEAIEGYRRVLRVDPNFAVAHSNLIYAMHFDPDYDAGAIAAELARFNERHAAPLKTSIRPHANDRSPDRRLRIGYVSPEFREHATMFFCVPLLEAHDHASFEVHCYASVLREDEVTARIRSAADVWHDCLGHSDAQVAEQVRRDEIDILVDLSMHMNKNRLLTFARKPAPVQVTWVAYPGATGLEAMDYRLTDSHLDPPGESGPGYAEQSVRLPDFWCCYDPLIDVPPRPPEQADPATICFGSLNNPSKYNEPVLRRWSRVLKGVPGSSLMLIAPPTEECRRKMVQTLDVEPSRIEFAPMCPRPQYLRRYDRIDIALDTLPHNGVTTTCDALWMGVPVVTLSGNIPAGRGAKGILATVGLHELIATTEDQFVAMATELARDVPRLTELHRGLRQRTQTSPLMDAERFARNVESAYRTMWRRWCERGT